VHEALEGEMVAGIVLAMGGNGKSHISF
jgi:hypothetical protein